MIAELMVAGGVRVTGHLGALVPDLLVGPQVFSRELIIGAVIVRAQEQSAVGVEGDHAGEIGMPDNEIHQVARLRFTGRIGSRTGLVVVLPPADRKIAVQVEAFLRAAGLDRDPVKVA